MFELSKPLCYNDFVNFKDFSTIPTATASAALNKWYWNFNGLSSSSLQNPAFLFKDGINFTKLIAESNFGCKSLEFDSNFIIYPKPMIKLSINCLLYTSRCV